MENFIVSARKYRPATFDTVVGQKNITATLKNAIKNQQLAQAFLFTGPRGVGKTTCARILAKTINCMNLTGDIEPCNDCESCVSFNRSASFNIHELDAASNNSVEDIRSLVDQVRIPPQIGRYKVYIIDEVHMLSQSAFNAFLKTLEEPPEYAKFILATTEKHKIIPTILSRCQIYDFKRIGVPDIINQLNFVSSQENVTADPMALNVIAQKADGAMRDALSIFDQLVSFTGNELSYERVRENLNVLDFEYYFKITEYLMEGNIPQILLTLNEILEAGFDGQHFLVGLGSHLRDVLVSQNKNTVQLLEVGDAITDQYLQQAEKCPSDFLLKALDILHKTDFTYKSSNNKRLHLEVALMQMGSITALHLQSLKSAPTSEPKKKTEVVTRYEEAKPENPEPEIREPVIQKPVEVRVSKPVEISVEKQTVKKPAAFSTKHIPGTISIREELSEQIEVNDEAEEYFDTGSSEYLNAKPIDFGELSDAWKEFADDLADKHPSLYSTMTSIKPEVGDDFEVLFEVKNIVQEKELENVKNDLIGALREKLGNRFMRLKININPLIEEMKPYSPEEIFRHMAGKNPAIIELKEKFDLEPE
nr:DNA polymerase III subunit gamma/tau [Bacteroidota bacterium]